jgi:hypothetical protein
MTTGVFCSSGGTKGAGGAMTMTTANDVASSADAVRSWLHGPASLSITGVSPACPLPISARCSYCCSALSIAVCR